jgi:DNA-directed RNA polymerase specialized sigma24 family protein
VRLDSRKVQIVEMRFFGGLSVEETAEVLKVSPVNVVRDWSTPLGALAYILPEQIRAEHLDARTDLFSFSVVL